MTPSHLQPALLAACAALACGSAAAQETVAQTIVIRGHYNNAVGTSDAASEGSINAELLKSRPAMRPGELLEFVPGLIVTQHSGDGKANQYFLRGFNLDHGTDFATHVAGMPVNMASHGHGQGYTDLNFLIPELVGRIDYRKGPYFASGGDFASAGAADISYRSTLDRPFGVVTLGRNGYARTVVGGSGAIGGGLQLLGAVELMQNDGPWTLPENLRRRNGVLTLSRGDASSGWSASLMGYSGRWVATDQVPQRLIDAGSYDGRPFGRFDAIDTTGGGDTSRSSLSGEWHHDSTLGTSKVSAYAMRYRLQLFSNFTYALERPADGDQFLQQDERSVYGLRASQTINHTLWGMNARSLVGADLRHDRIRVGLFDTAARRITGTTRDDQVRETLLGVYGQTTLEWTPVLRSIVGLRADTMRASVNSFSLPVNSGEADGSQLSPKFSLIAGPFAQTEFFFNAGRGFHSNDARGTVAQIDPRSGEAVDRVPALVPSRGYEVGARTEAIRGLQSSLALWKLDFGSELVYVGDAGNTEASAGSKRRGVEWNNRYTPVPWLLLDADFAWTHARFNNGDRIPNAVDRVASVAATLRDIGPWTASLQWRYLGAGALIEDNSVRSKSASTTNLRLSRKFGERFEATLDVFNLFDRKVDDIQYFYESQLPTESAPVADRHVHPAEPRALRVSLRMSL